MQNAISKTINQNLNINAKPKFVIAPIKSGNTQNTNSFKNCFLAAINTVQPNSPISVSAIQVIAQKQNGAITQTSISTYLGYGINNNAINRYTNGTTYKHTSKKGKVTNRPIYFYAPVKPPVTKAQLNTKVQNEAAAKLTALHTAKSINAEIAKIEQAKN